MKKRYLNIVVFALFVSMLWGCSDWTKPEAEDFFEMPGNDYYENLRAYNVRSIRLHSVGLEAGRVSGLRWWAV